MKTLAAALLLGSTLVLGAQQPAPASASAHPGLHVTLATAGGAVAFPLGARIRLVFSVSSSVRHRYASAYESSTRSGCVTADIHVSPSRGWHDPLAELGKVRIPMSLVCESGFGWLRAQPFVETFELNQWVRFDQPGDYTVVIRDPDITLPLRDSLLAPGGTHLMVVSNPLTLHIAAAPPGWRTTQLRNARGELEAAALAKPVDRRRVNDAVQTLAALGGARAGHLLAQLCARPGCNQNALAEAESPAAVLAELQRLLHDPALPVNQSLLTETTVFTLLANGDTGPNGKTANDSVVAEVARLLPQKQPAALGPSLAALLSIDASAVPDADRAWLTEALADHFDEMTPEQRSQCLGALNGPKDPLGGPAELAFVRHAATMALTGPFAGTSQAGALHRWYELAPAEARPAVLAAILDARAGANDLGFLPDKTLPQADAVLLNDLGAPQYTVRGEAATSLIARYASPAIADAVALALDAHASSWSCARRHGLVKYLLRVQPALAARALRRGRQPVAAGGCDWAAPPPKR